MLVKENCDKNIKDTEWYKNIKETEWYKNIKDTEWYKAYNELISKVYYKPDECKDVDIESFSKAYKKIDTKDLENLKKFFKNEYIALKICHAAPDVDRDTYFVKRMLLERLAKEVIGEDFFNEISNFELLDLDKSEHKWLYDYFYILYNNKLSEDSLYDFFTTVKQKNLVNDAKEFLKTMIFELEEFAGHDKILSAGGKRLKLSRRLLELLEILDVDPVESIDIDADEIKKANWYKYYDDFLKDVNDIKKLKKFKKIARKKDNIKNVEDFISKKIEKLTNAVNDYESKEHDFIDSYFIKSFNFKIDILKLLRAFVLRNYHEYDSMKALLLFSVSRDHRDKFYKFYKDDLDKYCFSKLKGYLSKDAVVKNFFKVIQDLPMSSGYYTLVPIVKECGKVVDYIQENNICLVCFDCNSYILSNSAMSEEYRNKLKQSLLKCKKINIRLNGTGVAKQVIADHLDGTNTGEVDFFIPFSLGEQKRNSKRWKKAFEANKSNLKDFFELLPSKDFKINIDAYSYSNYTASDLLPFITEELKKKIDTVSFTEMPRAFKLGDYLGCDGTNHIIDNLRKCNKGGIEKINVIITEGWYPYKRFIHPCRKTKVLAKKIFQNTPFEKVFLKDENQDLNCYVDWYYGLEKTINVKEEINNENKNKSSFKEDNKSKENTSSSFGEESNEEDRENTNNNKLDGDDSDVKGEINNENNNKSSFKENDESKESNEEDRKIINNNKLDVDNSDVKGEINNENNNKSSFKENDKLKEDISSKINDNIDKRNFREKNNDENSKNTNDNNKLDGDDSDVKEEIDNKNNNKSSLKENDKLKEINNENKSKSSFKEYNRPKEMESENSSAVFCSCCKKHCGTSSPTVTMNLP